MSSFHDGLEDEVFSLCGNKNNGYFIDIGAHDGVTGNNTQFLEDKGWDGICFEPHPKLFEKLKNNRKCQVHNLAIWNKNDNVNFLSIDGQVDMLSGIIESYDPRHVNRINHEISEYGGNSETLTVESKRFDSVITQKKIDFLSLDTEGSELKILETINFDYYDISVICVENNYQDDRLTNLLLTKGYRQHKTFGVDFIFTKIN
jgi:FkbM family methyltransferase